MKLGLSDLDRLISRIQPVQKEETVYDARTVVQKLLDNGFISVDELCDHFCGDGEIHHPGDADPSAVAGAGRDPALILD